MRAALITTHGQAPELGAREEPARPEGGVVIATTAVPVTPLDLLCASGTSYFGEPALPYVPGVQGVGVVRDGAPDLVGRRVWFATSAGMAPGDGSLAELAAARTEDVVPVPDGVDDATVAGLGLSAVAAWSVLASAARLTPGETVLVLGAGGAVGQVAVQAARLQGADRVVAAARSTGGRQLAERLGADAVVALEDDLDPATLATRFTEAAGGPVDVVVDPLAGVPGTAAALCLAERGRLVNFGGSAGPTLTVDSAALRSRSAQVVGYTNNALSVPARAAALTAVLEHAAAGRLSMEFDVVTLDQMPTAWEQLRDGERSRRIVALVGG